MPQSGDPPRGPEIASNTYGENCLTLVLWRDTLERPSACGMHEYSERQVQVRTVAIPIVNYVPMILMG